MAEGREAARGGEGIRAPDEIFFVLKDFVFHVFVFQRLLSNGCVLNGCNHHPKVFYH